MLDVQNGVSARGPWSKQEFVIEYQEGNFPTQICLNVWGEDKVKDLGLTLVESDLVQAPGIAELPLTLECKVLYRQLLDKNAVPEDIRKAMYPEHVDSSNPMANCDYHYCYYGKILKSYIIEQE